MDVDRAAQVAARDRLYPTAVPLARQEEAVEAILTELAVSRRTQIDWAPGTGKTALGAYVADRLRQGREPWLACVATPSLYLVQQTIAEWQRAGVGRHFRVLALCSDQTVAERKDLAEFSHSMAGVEVTTSAERVGEFVDAGGASLIVSTYASLSRLAEAQSLAVEANRGWRIDLLVCDEAHWLVGDIEDPYSLAVRGEEGLAPPTTLLADRRLFMTATPRRVRSRRGEEAVEWVSMEEGGNYFGRRCHSYTLGSAIKEGRLVPYRVIGMVVDEAGVRQEIESGVRGAVEGLADGRAVDARSLALVTAAVEAVRRYGLNHAVGFAPTIASSRLFAALTPLVDELSGGEERARVAAGHVDGRMSVAERTKWFRWLCGGSRPDGGAAGEGGRILWNARCALEGVDVPDIDGVVIAAAWRSAIAITQAVGRGLRPAQGKESARIVVPILTTDSGLPADESLGTMADIVLGLQEYDDELRQEQIEMYATTLGGADSPRLPRNVELVHSRNRPFGEEFVRSVGTEVLRRSVADFDAGVTHARSCVLPDRGSVAVESAYRCPEPCGWPFGSFIRRLTNRARSGELAAERREVLEGLPGWDELVGGPVRVKVTGKQLAEVRPFKVIEAHYRKARKAGATHSEILAFLRQRPAGSSLHGYALCREAGLAHREVLGAAARGVDIRKYLELRSRAGVGHEEAVAVFCDLPSGVPIPSYLRAREVGASHGEVVDAFNRKIELRQYRAVRKAGISHAAVVAVAERSSNPRDLDSYASAVQGGAEHDEAMEALDSDLFYHYGHLRSSGLSHAEAFDLFRRYGGAPVFYHRLRKEGRSHGDLVALSDDGVDLAAYGAALFACGSEEVEALEAGRSGMQAGDYENARKAGVSHGQLMAEVSEDPSEESFFRCLEVGASREEIKAAYEAGFGMWAYSLYREGRCLVPWTDDTTRSGPTSHETVMRRMSDASQWGPRRPRPASEHLLTLVAGKVSDDPAVARRLDRLPEPGRPLTAAYEGWLTAADYVDSQEAGATWLRVAAAVGSRSVERMRGIVGSALGWLPSEALRDLLSGYQRDPKKWRWHSWERSGLWYGRANPAPHLTPETGATAGEAGSRAAGLLLRVAETDLRDDGAGVIAVDKGVCLGDGEFVTACVEAAREEGELPLPWCPSFRIEPWWGPVGALGWLRVAVGDTTGAKWHAPDCQGISGGTAGTAPLWMRLYEDLCARCDGPGLVPMPELVAFRLAADVWWARGGPGSPVEEWQMQALLTLLAACSNDRSRERQLERSRLALLLDRLGRVSLSFEDVERLKFRPIGTWSRSVPSYTRVEARGAAGEVVLGRMLGEMEAFMAEQEVERYSERRRTTRDDSESLETRFFRAVRDLARWARTEPALLVAAAFLVDDDEPD